MKAGAPYRRALAGALALLFLYPCQAAAEVPWYRIPPGSAVKNPPFPGDDRAFISMIYDRLLGRSARIGEIADWEKRLRGGKVKRDKIVLKLLGSDEYFVRRLFLDVLGRPPEKEEMQIRLENLQGGVSRREVIRNLLNSPGYRATLR